MEEIPDTPIYCTANAVKSIEGQYGKRGWNFHVVKTGDSVDIGNGKKLIFVEMRMLHWPDSMATFMTGDNILFSNDAFGQHYAVEELFNDKADQCLLNKEAMKYFANILNPFAPILTKKLAEITGFNLTFDMIAPSHGAIWRENPLQREVCCLGERLSGGSGDHRLRYHVGRHHEDRSQNRRGDSPSES